MTRILQQVLESAVPAVGKWHGLPISRPSDYHEREADQIEGAYRRNVFDRQEQALGMTGSSESAQGSGASGGTLPPALREYFGAKLSHDFSSVRVHHDADADVLARGLAASAFTVGNDIYLRAGSYAPETDEGQRLLGHELLHVRQQHFAGRRLDRKIFSEEELEEMNPPSTTPQQGLLGSDPAFEQFADRLRTRYHVRTVRRGTFREQSQEVATRRVDLPPGVTRGTLDPSAWKEWSPPSGWSTYKAILDAIQSFARDFGGLPSIQEVVLFDVHYDVNETTGLVEAQPGVGASFGSGQLTIYSAITKSSALPAGRSGVPFAGREAALVPAASERQAIGRNVAHELGHGVAEMAVGPGRTGPDSRMLDDFRREIGWDIYRPATATSPAVPERLFDAGVPEVRAALTAGTEPPAEYRITQWNWNEGRWIEQPISQYSTTNPGDDFAESVMAFLKVPQTLRERSPRRYSFLETRKERWLPNQRAAPPPTGSTTGSAINPPLKGP
jgi:hypothetical protein